ncbi:phospho-sugar mutase [Caldanaerobius polysaccharolyticus]|uniref:phospho-sugar mutase n=1 Tax=Caldanaerobius polysaccharolyticus TaxID=44256 RepID=UPI0005509C3C|nr:phospho-sugar mutase [Caldanaerobius polysaccharolyticus]
MYKDEYNFWLNSDYFDEATKKELRAIAGDEKEIEDRFYKELEFGTGGLRGKIGAGTNRMNIYTVRKATQGLADYITSLGEDYKARGVVIAHDSRHGSREFALESAGVLNANGIKAYVFDGLRPTPELSFAVRKLKAAAGIVITASHNPPQYNGYKVYLEDGGQAVSPYVNEIMERIKKIKDITAIKVMEEKEAREKGLFVILDKSIDDQYVDMVKSQVLNPQLLKEKGGELSIIYTPLHGTGNVPVRRVLKELGFTDVRVVPQQEVPDPDFSTVRSPNPEEHDAFELALSMAKERGADIILGTDPDSDRVGVIVRDRQGQYVALTGHQQGILLTYYILSQLKERGQIPKNGVVIKTIATTDMLEPIAKDFGVEVENTLIGFKFIGEKIKEYESTGKEFVFGFEESYGYLRGTQVRDKDGVIASALFSEMALYYKMKGMTLLDVMEELYKKYGYYTEYLKSIVMEGKEGMERINGIMSKLREMDIKDFAGYEVEWRDDYLTGQARLRLPKSNVLRYNFKGGGYLLVRPSGTEPKIKIYISAVDSSKEKSEEKVNKIKDAILDLVK